MIITKGIILLGGEGSRFDIERPKQFHQLSGKKVYLHTLERFIESKAFDEIILVVHPKYLNEVKLEGPSCRVISGGKTRQESSWLGLQACDPCDYVVIHDAVRPFVSKEILLENCEKVLVHGAVDTCASSFDTIVQVEGEWIRNIPQREQMLRGQTPQSFSYDLIVNAHKRAMEKGIYNASDDCQLVLLEGHPVHVVRGSEHNIKLTTQLDLFLAEQLMRMSKNCTLSKDQSIKGKVFAVVGGSGGIGSSIVSILQENGAMALSLSQFSKEFPVDITKEEEVKEVFAKIEREFGMIDGLINAAGCLTKKNLEQFSIEEMAKELSVNLYGVIHTCKRASIKEGGHVINISSSSFTKGRAGCAIYSASKAGVVNFTQALAEERPHLQVNVVVPQRTKTALRLKNFQDDDLNLLLEPNEVAKVILDLLKTPTITGQIIEVRK